MLAYTACVQDTDFFLFPGLDMENTSFKTKFTIQLMDANKEKQFGYKLKIFCKEAGVCLWLRKAAGCTAAATVADYIMWMIKQEFPELRVQKVVVLCHVNGQPNLKAGVEVYFG